MKIGFLSTGPMAEKMAATIRQMEGVELYSVASRTPERAREFAGEQGFQKAFGSYEELANDPETELVYIATPHSRHYEDMLLCIEAGKPVLCEKAFTMNADEAEKIAALAKEKGVFVAEAIWPRYMPSRRLIDEALASGDIGKVHKVTANLSYVIYEHKRIVDPELAGGALLDVGVYGLNFVTMHFGREIERVDTSVKMTDTGVDGSESITLHYKDGRVAVLTHDIWSRSDRKGIFYGDKGYMVVENINNPSAIALYDTEDRLIRTVPVPQQISGYEYEVRACAECLEKGLAEAPDMPLAESIATMRLMDSIRAQWGLVYPKERR